MRVFKSSESETHGTETVCVYEYPRQDEGLGGAVAAIDGRYPQSGFVLNETVKQIVYVAEGQGRLLSDIENTSLMKGDIAFIDKGEKFAWDGKMTLFIANAPRFDVAQYKETP